MHRHVLSFSEIILDLGRFHVPEGLFTPEKWGIDNPGLHKLVHHAIQECGVDLRREMSRSIYVSGGVTLLPGFAERLENEVDKLTPNTITPKVNIYFPIWLIDQDNSFKFTITCPMIEQFVF